MRRYGRSGGEDRRLLEWPSRWRRDWARDRCVLAEREMGSRAQVVREVLGQDSVKPRRVHDNHVIEALTRIDPMTRST